MKNGDPHYSFPTAPRIESRRSRAALAQAGIAALALVAALFVPRPGAALLLVPLAGKAIAEPQLLSGNGLALIGRGRIPGSLIVHAGGGLPFAALLRRGIVPLSAPEILCTPQPPTKVS
ncbi:MAG: hypothetical protein KGN34_12470 [Sphingomonadales bacterium]|nr:hypothetical protein [Sphingomonadales bacterium]